jgi:cytidine deaminase
LLGKAREAATAAYAPYSGFRVGAALLTVGGKVYTGFNVENSSYSISMCAERVALYRAVADGERQFAELLIVAPDKEEDAPPCGACRQAFIEFSPNMRVTYRYRHNFVTRTISELLPDAFDKKNGNRSEGARGAGL